jgi:Cu(I)/Ag(I) efflux system membrane protein CusA/SilA
MPDTEPKPPGAVGRVIDFSGKNRVLVFLAALALAIAGLWSAKQTPLDALPDLSDTQVIVATEWMGRNPTLIEDQVTYPITTSFLGAPHVKAVRGFTMFGMSFVYVIFDDGTDIYWARSRAIEQLAKIQNKLPPGVTPQIGPDATSVGWVYQYALVDESGKHNLQELRSFQDWQLRYWLQAVPGVAEVASVGGFEKEYQIQVDPARMKARGRSSEMTSSFKRLRSRAPGRRPSFWCRRSIRSASSSATPTAGSRRSSVPTVNNAYAPIWCTSWSLSRPYGEMNPRVASSSGPHSRNRCDSRFFSR